MATYIVSLPRNAPWESKRAEQFMEQLLFSFQPLIFQIVADHERIAWQISSLDAIDDTAMAAAIRASYPDADVTVEPISVYRPDAQSVQRLLFRYHYLAPVFVAPILTVDEIKTPDPLAVVTQAMTGLRPGERITYTLLVVGFASYAYKEGQQLITRNVYHGGWLDLLFPDKAERYTPDLQHVLEDKLQRKLYQCLLFVQVDSPEAARLEPLSMIDSQMVHFNRAKFNGVACNHQDVPIRSLLIETDEQDFANSAFGQFGIFLQMQGNKKVDAAVKKTLQATRLIFEPRELASLWHLPHTGFQAPTIAWTRRQHSALPQVLVGKRDGVCLGVNAYRGQHERVYMPEASRATHIAVVGKPGTGKSTLLHHLIHQDIQQNRGVAVIDPHGRLVQDVLRLSIPEHREQDVVVLDFADEGYPPPLNLLGLPDGVDRTLAANRLLTVLEKQGSFEDTVTVLPTLRAALLTLWQEATPTIRDVVRLFDDPDYRERLLAALDNPAVEDFWRRYDAKKGGQQEQLSTPVVNRLSDFYGNPHLYPITCHPDLLDFTSLIAERKIILVSLPADEAKLPRREQQLLGALVIAQIQTAVMSGAAQNAPFYLYVDEAQRFVTTALDEMLSEARKYNLSLTLANQYLKQLAGNTLDALMGTVGALVTFQCGLDDARALTPYLKPGFDTDDLLNLDLYSAAVSMRYAGDMQPAFSIQTIQPRAKTETLPDRAARESYLRSRSIQSYTPKTRDEVKAWLKARYTRRQATTADTPLTQVSFYE